MTTMSVSGLMFLLVPAHPGCPGQIPQSHKTVVCVCITNDDRSALTLFIEIFMLSHKICKHKI